MVPSLSRDLGNDVAEFGAGFAPLQGKFEDRKVFFLPLDALGKWLGSLVSRQAVQRRSSQPGP
jgi:hypothetical protein